MRQADAETSGRKSRRDMASRAVGTAWWRGHCNCLGSIAADVTMALDNSLLHSESRSGALGERMRHARRVVESCRRQITVKPVFANLVSACHSFR
jgi:hypothetical protein